MADDRVVTLDDPKDRWAVREGYLTEMSVLWGSGVNTTTQHFTQAELQAIVNAADSQYGLISNHTSELRQAVARVLDSVTPTGDPMVTLARLRELKEVYDRG